MAVTGALRHDPDVIMIGEMRDLETLLAGIQAAETGHLVYVTLHTSDTMQAFTRRVSCVTERTSAVAPDKVSTAIARF